jgi:hypothetical protein
LIDRAGRGGGARAEDRAALRGVPVIESLAELLPLVATR